MNQANIQYKYILLYKLFGKELRWKGKGKATPSTSINRVTVPFKPTDRILLIGEGNFSFARALTCSPPPALEFLPPSNIVATAYDTEEECCSKYPEAIDIISSLRKKGVEILFSVDATKLDKCVPLRGRKFDRIVWNFPHAGMSGPHGRMNTCLLPTNAMLQAKASQTRTATFSPTSCCYSDSFALCHPCWPPGQCQLCMFRENVNGDLTTTIPEVRRAPIHRQHFHPPTPALLAGPC